MNWSPATTLRPFSVTFPVTHSIGSTALVIGMLISSLCEAAPAPSPAPPRARAEMKVTDADRDHWAFRPLGEFLPPTPKDSDWVRTPVDRFIRQAQEERRISPTSPADARTLVRRIYFDLIGLPPTPDETTRWTARIQESPEASRELVDELLASPHYGERWARHWLDVARYADSNGMEGDGDRLTAYHFRDFVIRALNGDMPYDRFVRWQLAGDEIAPDEPEAIAATGFLAAGVHAALPDRLMEEEKLRNRADELDDMVSTTGQALLGLTLACARCHDHKYDPVPTRDYYRLMRAFNGGDRAEVPLATRARVKSHRDELIHWKAELDAAVGDRDRWFKEARAPHEKAVRAAKIAQLPIPDSEKRLLENDPEGAEARKLAGRYKKALTVKDEDYLAGLGPDQQARWDELDARVKRITAGKPAALPTAFAFADFAPEPRESWFFERGDFMARKERMDLGFLTVLQRGRTADDYWRAAKESRLREDTTQQRRALAQWMTDLDHGAGALLARVMVNRVWQHHFGAGLARTVSDFGTRGDPPTHPELLEWLAAEFVRSGWSVKHLHRLMMNTAAYRLGGALGETSSPADPESRFLTHRRPQRLESEILRDSMLAVAGSLNAEMHGPSFRPPIAPEAMQARNVRPPYPRDAKDTPETRRRSVYMFHKRVVQYPLMQAFDAPDAQVSCGQRMNTTVAPQALALLNDPFVRLRAEEFANRLHDEAGTRPEARVRLGFRLALAREPDPWELAAATAFIESQTEKRRGRDASTGSVETAGRLALTDFCQSLFGLNEFIYVD
ncbi:MAG: DUF1549 and DUF1553 domain-containing protein [Limisphaerales bacterium]